MNNSLKAGVLIAGAVIAAVALLAARNHYLAGVPRAKPAISNPERAAKAHPFGGLHRVADGIYVHDRAHFTKYEGPPLSAWNANARDGILEKKRLGAIAISPGTILDIERQVNYKSEFLELIDPRTRRAIHRFTSSGSGEPPLLFDGEGTVHAYEQVRPLCWGSATRKYEFAGTRLVETHQPVLTLGVETELLQEAVLRISPAKQSAPVVTLPKGSPATVLTYQVPGKFLLKTPLGLTGWLVADAGETMLTITECN